MTDDFSYLSNKEKKKREKEKESKCLWQAMDRIILFPISYNNHYIKI